MFGLTILIIYAMVFIGACVALAFVPYRSKCYRLQSQIDYLRNINLIVRGKTNGSVRNNRNTRRGRRRR